MPPTLMGQSRNSGIDRFAGRSPSGRGQAGQSIANAPSTKISVTPPEDLSQLGTDGPPGARSQLRLPGAGCGGWEHHDLPRRFGRLPAAPLLAYHVKLRSIAAAERAGEGTSVQFDRGKNLAPLAHPHAVSGTHVGQPDGALGIEP